MVQRTMSTLTAMGGEASRGLLELLKPGVPHSVRLGAIRTVLEFGMKLASSPNWRSAWRRWSSCKPRRRGRKCGEASAVNLE